jgi:hypothetical protein
MKLLLFCVCLVHSDDMSWKGWRYLIVRTLNNLHFVFISCTKMALEGYCILQLHSGQIVL